MTGKIKPKIQAIYCQLRKKIDYLDVLLLNLYGEMKSEDFWNK